MRLRAPLLAVLVFFGLGLGELHAAVPQLIASNVAASELRKKMIRDAGPKDEILYTTFNFYLEAPVLEMVRLLGDQAASRRKAGNRVPITVIVDGHFVDNTAGSPSFRTYQVLQWLASQGVRTYVYNPLRPLAPGASAIAKLWINHRKILVVGSSVLMGSRNAGATHLTDFHQGPSSNFIDADVFTPPGFAPDFAASAAALIQEMSRDRSNSVRIQPGAQDPGQLGLPAQVKIATDKIWGNALDGTYDWRLHRTDWATGVDPTAFTQALQECMGGLPGLIESLLFPDPRLIASCASLVRILNRNADQDEFRQAVRQAIRDEPAWGEILIESPYFYPDPETLAEITKAVRRNVRLHVITNSIYSSGGISKLILIYMDPYFQRWIHDGKDRVQIEFSTDHNVHAKTFSFRGQKLFFVGSHNLHPRSGTFDTEAGVSFRADREDFINLRTWYYVDFETKVCRTAGHSANILVAYSPIDLKALQHVLDVFPGVVDWVGAPTQVTSAVKSLAGALRGSSSLSEFSEKPGEWRITRAHRYLVWRTEVTARSMAIRAAFNALEPIVGPFL